MNDYTDTDDINNMDDGELFDLLDYLVDNKNDTESPQDSIDYCKTCNSSENISSDYSQGIIVCTGCGTIISSNVYDEGAEWHNYTGDGKESFVRCSSTTNPFLPQSSLGTMISGSSAYRLKKIQTWTYMPYKERALNIVLKEIAAQCANGNILKCIEDDAKILYKHISDSKNKPLKHKISNIRRGTNRKSIIAACIFYACKRNGKTRNPKEIAEMCKLKHKSVTKGCKLFQELTKLQFIGDDKNISAAEHFIPRYCKVLKIDADHTTLCIELARNIHKLQLDSMHTPVSIAHCTVLLIAEKYNLGIDKKCICDKFKISEVTLFKTLKKLEPYIQILMNSEIVDALVESMENDRETLEIPDFLKQEDDFVFQVPEKQKNVLTIDPAQFSLYNPKLIKYINNLTADMYDIFGETDLEYKNLLEKML